MGVVEGVGAARPARRDARVAVETESLAWLLAVPVALLAIALIALLGPPLGRLLHSGGAHYTFWTELRWAVRPEPTEQGRYLLSLAAPFVLAGALVASARRGLAWPRRRLPCSRPRSSASSCRSGSSTKSRYTRWESSTAGATSRPRRSSSPRCRRPARTPCSRARRCASGSPRGC